MSTRLTKTKNGGHHYLPFVMFLRNISLKPCTSFKIGGKAKYFFKVKNLKGLIKAVNEAHRLKIPILVVGDGTKLLVNDKGFKGLVIKIQNTKYEILNTKIVAEAGVGLNRLVSASIKVGLTGLEWAIEIPGTIGGAIHGNSGAFGSSLSEIVKNVTALNPHSLKIKKYSNQQCRFGYRDSVFKHNKDIIVSAELQLKKGGSKKGLVMMKEYLKRRRERIPVYSSAGSIFKNYELRSINYENDILIKKFPDLKKQIKGGKIPVAYLIEECGLKGKRIGGAKISEKQANIIVNFNKAKAKDVSALIDLVKKRTRKKFGVTLEEEVIRV